MNARTEVDATIRISKRGSSKMSEQDTASRWKEVTTLKGGCDLDREQIEGLAWIEKARDAGCSETIGIAKRQRDDGANKVVEVLRIAGRSQAVPNIKDMVNAARWVVQHGTSADKDDAVNCIAKVLARVEDPHEAREVAGFVVEEGEHADAVALAHLERWDEAGDALALAVTEVGQDEAVEIAAKVAKIARGAGQTQNVMMRAERTAANAGLQGTSYPIAMALIGNRTYSIAEQMAGRTLDPVQGIEVMCEITRSNQDATGTVRREYFEKARELARQALHGKVEGQAAKVGRSIADIEARTEGSTRESALIVAGIEDDETRTTAGVAAALVMLENGHAKGAVECWTEAMKGRHSCKAMRDGLRGAKNEPNLEMLRIWKEHAKGSDELNEVLWRTLKRAPKEGSEEARSEERTAWRALLEAIVHSGEAPHPWDIWIPAHSEGSENVPLETLDAMEEAKTESEGRAFERIARKMANLVGARARTRHNLVITAMRKGGRPARATIEILETAGR